MQSWAGVILAGLKYVSWFQELLYENFELANDVSIFKFKNWDLCIGNRFRIKITRVDIISITLRICKGNIFALKRRAEITRVYHICLKNLKKTFFFLNISWQLEMFREEDTKDQLSGEID